MADNFAHRAAEWDNPSKTEMTRKFVAALLKKVDVQAAWKAFEIGAGTGLVGLQILPYVQRMIFEDTSPAMLDVLREKLTGDENIEIVEGEVFNYDKQDIDFVFACMSLHHVPDIEAALKHLNLITKKNATVVIGDLRTEDGSFHRFEPIPHQGFDTDKLSSQFENAGFQVLDCDTYNTLLRERIPGTMYQYEQFMLVARKL
ncbi:MAG: hypothetical protein AUK44_06245 [Porphyromonadaceae bacterium CG2_30_38_12]|nr:MAG: hypothetical protein AUK44_06245 [Porphyromonadaceae bacterium CG2_30_38_12]